MSSKETQTVENKADKTVFSEPITTQSDTQGEAIYGGNSCYTVFQRQYAVPGRSEAHIITMRKTISMLSVFIFLFAAAAMTVVISNESFLTESVLKTFLGSQAVGDGLQASAGMDDESVFGISAYGNSGSSKSSSIEPELYSDMQILTERVTGILMSTVTDSMSRTYRLPMGVAVEKIRESGDVTLSELSEGDIIISINGERVFTINDVLSAVYCNVLSESREEIKISVYRGGTNTILLCGCNDK